MTDAEIPEPRTTLAPLAAAINGIDYPDSDAEFAAAQRQLQLIKPPGSLGRLEELAAWVASTQGACPPHDFHRARLVIFAGDHGIAAAGVSAAAAGQTAELLAVLAAGGAAPSVVADTVGVGVRVVDLAVDADTDEAVSGHKIRRASGRIDREDALTRDEAVRALEAGIAIADEEIDSGADLLIAGDLGVANSTPAATLISILTDTEPIKVIGRGSGIGDAAWICKCAAVRDARRRGWPHREDTAGLLATVGGADLAAITGFVLQAAYRRTPVLLDGMVVCAAALVAQRANARIVRWVQAGHLSTEPAHAIALDRMGLSPILDLQLSLGQGTGALLALPLVRAAIRTLAEMSTSV
jgi:nicotinate-nucleotide--dimethylbenzimidazole phosphoribosyltransferase